MTSVELASGARLIEAPAETDDRGSVAEFSPDVSVIRELVVESRARVLRGLHFQDPRSAPLTKVLTVEVGMIFEVLVSLKTGHVDWLWLSEGDRKMLVVPPWTAHGYLVATSPLSRVRYRFDAARDEAAERQVHWESVGEVPWPVPAPTLSSKDASAPQLSAVMAELAREYVPPLTESRA